MWDMFWSGKQPAVSLFGVAPVMAEDSQAKRNKTIMQNFAYN